MLITITNPTGIDAIIYDLQSYLHPKLLIAWGINTSQYLSYGRCYRNKKGNGYVAEVYQGSNEYKEVYWDDSYSAVSFFGIGTAIESGVQQKVPVHLVVFANLNLVKPSTHREDENLRWDVMNLLQSSFYNDKVRGIDLGIENVLREYPGSYRDTRLSAVDVHPIHCFRINLELTYDNNNTCTITNTI